MSNEHKNNRETIQYCWVLMDEKMEYIPFLQRNPITLFWGTIFDQDVLSTIPSKIIALLCLKEEEKPDCSFSYSLKTTRLPMTDINGITQERILHLLGQFDDALLFTIGGMMGFTRSGPNIFGPLMVKLPKQAIKDQEVLAEQEPEVIQTHQSLIS